MKKKEISTAVFLLSAALVFVGAGCATTSTDEPTNTTSAAVNNSATMNENKNQNTNSGNTIVADLNTYENAELGITFQYPKDWSISQEGYTNDPETGKQYAVILKNAKDQSMTVYANTADFVPSEGEGDKRYVTGDALTFNASVDKELENRSVNVYQNIITKNDRAIFWREWHYVSATVYPMAVLYNTNSASRYPFVTVNGQSVITFNAETDPVEVVATVDTDAVDEVIDEYGQDEGEDQGTYEAFLTVAESLEFTE
ncbi:MAG: hypothetical protein HYV32_02925 [Candidatus Kerfeldbacteria bacterium]|nr:hypothetical protein [Candidatus Kerfeldbacteria bacterium]